MSTTDDLLAERYGRGRGARAGRRRGVVAASGIIGVVALGWLVWVVVVQATPQVQSRSDGYEVVDTHTAVAQVTVTLADPAVEATCLARAIAADSSVVGEQTFRVTGLTEPRRVSVDVRTEREADSVVVVGCTTPEQSRPR